MTQPAEKLTESEREETARRRQEKLEALRRDIQAGRDSGSVGHIPLDEMLAKARRRFNGEL